MESQSLSYGYKNTLVKNVSGYHVLSSHELSFKEILAFQTIENSILNCSRSRGLGQYPNNTPSFPCELTWTIKIWKYTVHSQKTKKKMDLSKTHFTFIVIYICSCRFLLDHTFKKPNLESNRLHCLNDNSN